MHCDAICVVQNLKVYYTTFTISFKSFDFQLAIVNYSQNNLSIGISKYAVEFSRESVDFYHFIPNQQMITI